MRRLSACLLVTMALMAPLFVFAVDSSFGQVGLYVSSFIDFLNRYLVPLVFALAFLIFIWGMFKYLILGGGNSEGQEQGRQLMLWGVIAFVAMISVWGVVNVVAQGLGFSNRNAPNLPVIPIPGGSSGASQAPGATGAQFAPGGSNGVPTTNNFQIQEP